MSLAPLLENTPEAAYWMGFIFADGSFTYPGARLSVMLASPDKDHLQKLADYLHCSNSLRKAPKQEAYMFAHMDTDNGFQILQHFDLQRRKTYNPPRHLPYTGALLRAFLVGYIDGDGTIGLQTGRKTAYIATTAHSSWETFLISLRDALGFGVVAWRNNGRADYVGWGCYKHNDVVALRAFAQEHNLPMLGRKWEKIDASIIITRGEKAATARKLVLAGETNNEIYRVMTISSAQLHDIRTQLGVSDPFKQKISAMHAGGATSKEIQKTLGLHSDTVYKYRNYEGKAS